MDNYFFTKEKEKEKEKNETGYKQKKRKRIKDELFKIIEPYEYNNIYHNSYSIKQLKELYKYYNIKTTGLALKKELEEYLYNYLKKTYYIKKIQCVWRKHIWNRIKILSGPALFNKSLCINTSDFYTMDDIKDISFNQFISIIDKNGKVYGFDIISLYNIYKKGNKPYENPYTRDILDKEVYDNLQQLIYLLTIMNEKPVLEYEENIAPEKQLELKCLNIFQYINALGNYTEHTWFWNLNHFQLERFIQYLIDIWEYRAQLSFEVKCKISPPYGNPFIKYNYHNTYNYTDLYRIRSICIEMIENIVTNGINESFKILGSNYVLCALTLVSNDAASALPWLYESVI